MKKIGLILFAFLAMTFSAVAQDNGERRARREGPRMNKEQMVENMTKRQVERLKLTKEQTDQMKVLNEALVTEMMANNPGRQVRTESAATRRQMTSEQREAARKEREKRTTEMQSNYAKKVKAVLTPEQFAEFEKMQKERPQGRNQNGRRGGQGGPRGGQGGGPRGGQGGFGGGR